MLAPQGWQHASQYVPPPLRPKKGTASALHKTGNDFGGGEGKALRAAEAERRGAGREEGVQREHVQPLNAAVRQAREGRRRKRAEQ